MVHGPALKVAFDLLDFPSQVRAARVAPLPLDLVVLMRIAAGDDETTQEAAHASGRSQKAVRDAAGFFIEQILLLPEANSYRVLGATPSAANFELRRNMALLLRWLHPDVDPRGERSIFAARVTKAWSDLKTAERRAAYDQRLQKSQADALLHHKVRRSRRSRRSASMLRHQLHPVHFAEDSFLRRLWQALFGRAVL